MIVCDTGPPVAAAIVSQQHHRGCIELFTGLRLAGRRLLVPSPVVAETDFLLEKFGGHRAESDS